MISEEKLGVLYYVSKNVNKFKDLYKLTQDCRSCSEFTFCDDEQERPMDTYYTISQKTPV